MAKHHPHKEISSAIEFALSQGWRFEHSRGHIYGTLYCPERSRDGRLIRVYSTPRNAYNHASFIENEVKKCEHSGEEQ